MKTFWRLSEKSEYSVAIELKSILPDLKKMDTSSLEDKLRKTRLLFYSEEKVKPSVWVRLTLPVSFIVVLILFILTPINYIITGHWGYRYLWLKNWLTALGF